MRLPDNRTATAIAAALLLSGCLGSGGGDSPRAAGPAAPRSGPAADYPMVIGDPFTIDGETYTPADKLNFDAVGYAVTGAEGGVAVSAAHKTLPLPSYVEVTSLVNGRTILVRVERRGPMRNDRLIELSPGAAEQLGVSAANADKSPVRVRRVNPPEVERAMLRAGQPAPPRMDTPRPLVGVLLRKLEPGLAVSPVPEAAPAPVAPAPSPDRPAAPSASSSTPAPPVEKPAAPKRAAAAARGYIVQVAAFSTNDRAKAAAAALGGEVSQAGRLWRVRLGPFAARGEADAALAKARRGGYSDARIQRAD